MMRSYTTFSLFLIFVMIFVGCNSTPAPVVKVPVPTKTVPVIVTQQHEQVLRYDARGGALYIQSLSSVQKIVSSGATIHTVCVDAYPDGTWKSSVPVFGPETPFPPGTTALEAYWTRDGYRLRAYKGGSGFIKIPYGGTVLPGFVVKIMGVDKPCFARGVKVVPGQKVEITHKPVQ